ncbi:MAG: F0F1 ATP synthase subunit B [Mycobacteriales bacterium]
MDQHMQHAARLLAAGDRAAEESPNPVIPHTAEIILVVIVFLILVWLMKKYVTPRFEQTYAERTEAIEGGIKRAEEAQAEAAAALKQYQEQLAGARSEAAQIRENARAEGQRIVEDMREAARTESDRIQAHGEAELAASRRQVVSELRTEIGQLSVQLAGRVLGENLEDETRRRGTVDRFIDELDGMSEPAGASGGATAIRPSSGPPGSGQH